MTQVPTPAKTPSQFNLILVTSLSTMQIDQVHAFVKGSSITWWHQVENVWIVLSPHSAAWWRDRLSPIIYEAPDGILVITLTPQAYALKGIYPGDLGREWFRENFNLEALLREEPPF